MKFKYNIAGSVIIVMIIALYWAFSDATINSKKPYYSKVPKNPSGYRYSPGTRHLEPGTIGVSKETRSNRLSNYCLDGDDNILACDKSGKVVRVINADDSLLATWKLDFGPEAIENRADSTTIVAGSGQAAILDDQGKVIKQTAIPGTAASGLGHSGDDIFIAVREKTSFAVYRMDGNLEGQTQIIDNLRGCCGQLDITAKDGIVYVAANTLFKVVKYDRTGKKIGSFGKKGRSGADTFKGCCEPKNVYFDAEGYLYTSESSQCCIKKFTADGKFLEHIGNVSGIHGCVRTTIAASTDMSRFYMLDTGRNVIRRFPLSEMKAPKMDTEKFAKQDN